MSRFRLTVVLSQAPGKHPAKRALEENHVAALLLEAGVEASIIPNLYDLDPAHTGRLFLESVKGDAIILSWLYPRAAFWLLDRIGIQGKFGETQLKPVSEVEDEEGEAEAKELKGVGPTGEIPDRFLYCLDLRDFNQAEPYLKEIRRIYEECKNRAEAREASKASKPMLLELGIPSKNGPGPAVQAFSPEALLAAPNRRWYPVIDYSRCTNCMECLDFCLFGVYGVNHEEKILVENQDQCKKGCPACSRVCPEQAIMFPEYKSAAIAGANTGSVTGLKIDLTKLFGGDGKDAVAQAVEERDRELVADGRQAVGAEVGLKKRQANLDNGPKDDLDKLMDDLDALGL
jgi:NAD-dependent dihydropyrimidine dehydrogenase PreA subunit